jgi:hypothetical protein
LGENAVYQGHRVKIGTCEDMLYLRADQAALVERDYRSLDPVREREAVRFRFPWPDEDGTEPGAFGDPFRVLGVEGARAPDGVEHRGGCDGGTVRLFQVRWWEGLLVPVCRCGCGALYRLPDADDGIALADALRVMAERAEDESRPDGCGEPALEAARRAEWLRIVALRVLDGYREGAGDVIARQETGERAATR